MSHDPADIAAKFSRKHRAIFGTLETASGEIVQAIQFPDHQLYVAGRAIRRLTLHDALNILDRLPVKVA